MARAAISDPAPLWVVIDCFSGGCWSDRLPQEVAVMARLVGKRLRRHSAQRATDRCHARLRIPAPAATPQPAARVQRSSEPPRAIIEWRALSGRAVKNWLTATHPA